MVLSACRPSPASLAPGDAENPIAPEFTAFWEAAGGLATFGPPIEPARRRAGVLTQTFLAVRLDHVPDDQDQPVRLAPLGLELGLAEPAAPPIDGQSGQYFPQTGHTVYPGFAPLFGALGGLSVVGPPITEVRFQGGRITQYFENLGMVRAENASPSDVRLVALGLASLPDETAFGMQVDQVVLPGIVRQRPFAEALEAFGGEVILGQPLSDPYTTDNGELEQVYERAVVFAESATSPTVRFRDVGLEWWTAAPPAPRSNVEGGLYIEDTGHNVLYAFADFYRLHDGEVLLGRPLEEVRVEGSGLAQRFEKGELVYRYDLPPGWAVQLSPIGQSYLALHGQPTPMVEAPPPTPTVAAPTPAATAQGGSIRLEVTVSRAVIHPGDIQEVSIRITSSNGKPIEGIRPRITWYGLREYGNEMAEPSGKKGWTVFRLRLEDTTPFEVITLVISVRDGEDEGRAVLQYAIGLPAQE
ncbi:MAG TPA: hypothetical protein VFI11_00725 [Anaerolineales bacterium]|nr:hypothetical protein [Anaerolineales bacterium]